MTDLVGDCLVWDEHDEHVVVVRPASGETVRIPIGDIVSGKPVPPRPSVRHRVSVAEAEAHTAVLATGVETASLGGWTLRSETAPTGRLRRRLNSCLAVAAPEIPLPEALAQVRAHYAERGRPTYLQVESDGDVERAASEQGWRVDPTGDADFLLASVSRVRRTLPRGLRPADLAVTGPRAVASVGDGCDTVAEGAAAVDGDWLGLHGLKVDPGHRRRGLGTAVVAALLEWGAEQGATTAWLHVEVDNTPARVLYEGLGFSVHHTTRYLTPPD